MKKLLPILTLVTLMCTMIACSGTSNTDETEADSATLPLGTQLLVGTFKLEGTDLAVDSSEAAELLPLWQTLDSLRNSDTTAPEEIDAAIAQIQDTMHPDQVKAITEMKLTQQDVFSIMTDLGLVASRPNANSTPGANFQVIPGGGAPGGGEGGQVIPGGGAPGGGEGGQGFPGGGYQGGGEGFNPQQIATAQAGKAQNGGINYQIPQILLNAIIDLLQKKIQP